MMRIFLDANILFSAAKSDGAVRYLIQKLKDAGHELCADVYVVEEAQRNLAIQKTDTDPLTNILSGIAVDDLPTIDRNLFNVIDLPDKDLPVFAAAMRLKCDVLVTGDRKHFGSYFGTTVAGVTIYSPAQLATRCL